MTLNSNLKTIKIVKISFFVSYFFRKKKTFFLIQGFMVFPADNVIQSFSAGNGDSMSDILGRCHIVVQC